MLRRTAREGTGIVAVLHDLTLAARFCDRIVVMEAGRIVADGPPDRALTDARLAATFGVSVRRGRATDGTAYLLPWDRAITEDVTDATSSRRTNPRPF